MKVMKRLQLMLLWQYSGILFTLGGSQPHLKNDIAIMAIFWYCINCASTDKKVSHLEKIDIA